jgi:hypothetical protein
MDSNKDNSLAAKKSVKNLEDHVPLSLLCSYLYINTKESKSMMTVDMHNNLQSE